MLIDSDIAEKALAPGNLVYGDSIQNLASHIDRGIKTAFGANGNTSREYSKDICLALLGKHRLPARYWIANHFGPKYPFDFHRSVGIIVSGEGLRDSLKDQVFAIGEYFWHPEKRTERETFYRGDENMVYGFTTRAYTGISYNDEVRVFPNDPTEVSISPLIWTGIVIQDRDFDSLRELKLKTDLTQPLPVLSADCELLARDLREIVL